MTCWLAANRGLRSPALVVRGRGEEEAVAAAATAVAVAVTPVAVAAAIPPEAAGAIDHAKQLPDCTLVSL